MLDTVYLNNILKNLIGATLTKIFYQPTEGLLSDDNMFVLKFDKENEAFAINAFCFVRFANENGILLTSSDEYFDKNFNRLTFNDYKKQKRFEKSLLMIRISEILKLLSDSRVVYVLMSKVGDIKINFDNGIELEISIDCSYENYEYYRFMDLKHEGNVVVVYFKDRSLRVRTCWE